jgi:hypothetical protein
MLEDPTRRMRCSLHPTSTWLLPCHLTVSFLCVCAFGGRFRFSSCQDAVEPAKMKWSLLKEKMRQHLDDAEQFKIVEDQLKHMSGASFLEQSSDSLVRKYSLPRAIADNLMVLHKDMFPRQSDTEQTQGMLD